MRLVNLLALLLAPLSANAEPVTTAIALYVGVSAATATLILQIAITVGMSVYGAARQRKLERQRKNDYNAALTDRTATRVTSESPDIHIYGMARVGCTIIGIFKGGDKDQYKYLVCVHADHKCTSFEEMYIAGKAIGLGTLDANGDVTTGDYFSTRTEFGTIWTSGTSVTLPSTYYAGSVQVYRTDDAGEGRIEYAVPFTVSGLNVTFENPNSSITYTTYTYAFAVPRLRIRMHLGVPGDPADAMLLSELPGVWLPSDTVSGRTYSVIRLDLNQPEFAGGPPSVEALIKGWALYDYRSGLTAWSDLAALAIYHYLTNSLCNVDPADFPMAQWITTANVCDENYSFGKRYTINGTVAADESQAGVLERMADAMAGGIVPTTWDIYAGTYTAPVMDLVQSDIVGAIAVTSGVSDSDLYNGVRGQYTSPETLYVATDFPEYSNATYVAIDGGPEWHNEDFHFTNTGTRVHNLCRIKVESQRNGFMVKGQFSLKAWSIKVGERIRFSSEFWGIELKVFRVTDRGFSPTSMIELTLVEDAATIWDFADSVVADDTPNSNLGNPFNIEKLTSLTCESGTNVLLKKNDGTIDSRILLSWPPAPTLLIRSIGRIEIEYKEVSSLVWKKTDVEGNALSTYLVPVNDRSIYNIRARCFNPQVQSYSDWTYADHKVIGKTEPPPNYDVFTIKFQPDGTREFEFAYTTTPTPADLAGPVIRYIQGLPVSPDWDTMLPLNSETFPYPSSPYETNRVLAGPHVFALRASDDTRNLATTPLYIQTTLPDRRLGNILDEYYEHVEGWLGTKTGCSVIEGILEANNSATWATKTTWTTFTRWNGTPTSPITYETPVRDIGTVVSGGINSNMVATGTTTIQMRTSVDNVTWSAYGDAGALFTARYLQFKTTVTATVPEPVPAIMSWIIQVQADVIKENINDLVISSLTGGFRIGVGDIRIPLAYSYNVVKRISVAIQDSTSTGWTWAIIDKTASGPRLQFRANGVLADPAKVDFYIEGS